MKWERTEVWVPIPGWHVEKRPAERLSGTPFAVNKYNDESWSDWSLTHTPTGLSLGTYGDKRYCKRVAKYLALHHLDYWQTMTLDTFDFEIASSMRDAAQRAANQPGRIR